MGSVGPAMVLSSLTIVAIGVSLFFKLPGKSHSQKLANATAICAIASIPLWFRTFFTRNEAEIIPAVTNLVGVKYTNIILFLGSYLAILIIASLIGITILKCTYKVAQLYESRSET